MEIFKIKQEDPQHAYNRVCKELKEASFWALGSDAAKEDIDEYNRLHEQVRRRHRDGTIGHLHLKREIILFDAKVVIPAPDKKIPFKLKP